MKQPPPLLSLEKVRHQYGQVVALEELNLQIHPGEIFGLLGPNGAGKTTTIKIATALLRPTSGQVVIDGEPVHKNPTGAKKIYGLMADNPFFYDKLSGRQFLAFIGNIHEIPPEELEPQMDSLFRFFELAEAADAPIMTYSLGMKKKLGLAAAMIHQPKILFLDEPTSGLDPLSSRNTKNLLKQLREKDITVFLTTHLLEMAEELCDRVGIINRGKLVAVGSIEELRSRDKESLEALFLRITGGG